MLVQDRRVRRTQGALERALLELSAEKSYDAVTIRELTERAGVGYATFFRHYPSKDALLLGVLGDTINELIGRLQPRAEAGRLAEAGGQLFAYVAEHAAVVRMFLSALGNPAIQRRMQEVALPHVMAALGKTSSVPPELAAHHLFTASTSLIGWWLAQGMPLTPEQMGVIYARLVVAPIRDLA